MVIILLLLSVILNMVYIVEILFLNCFDILYVVNVWLGCFNGIFIVFIYLFFVSMVLW